MCTVPPPLTLSCLSSVCWVVGRVWSVVLCLYLSLSLESRLCRSELCTDCAVLCDCEDTFCNYHTILLQPSTNLEHKILHANTSDDTGESASVEERGTYEDSRKMCR